MLDAVSPQQFDEWIAFRQIEPDPLDRLAEILKLGFAAIVNAWGGDATPGYFDPGKEEATGSCLGPAQTEAIMRSVYGE